MCVNRHAVVVCGLTSNRIDAQKRVRLRLRRYLRRLGHAEVVDAHEDKVQGDERIGHSVGFHFLVTAYCRNAHSKRHGREHEQEDQSCADGARPPKRVFVRVIGRSVAHRAKDDESREHRKTHQTHRYDLNC